MKLIRDIISEKRQMASQAEYETAAEPTDTMPEEHPIPQETVAPENAPRSDASADTQSDTPADTPVDDFAAFFADEEEQFPVEPDQVAEPVEAEQEPLPAEDVPAAQPSKLVLGKAFAVEGEDETALQHDASAAIAPAEPVAEAPTPAPEPQDTDQSLRDVFRELNDTPQEPVDLSSDAPQSDPVEDTEHRIDELLKTQPAGDTPPHVSNEPPAAAPPVVDVAPQSVEVPQPAAGRGMSRHGRVKTRLLGFNTAMDAEIDPIKGSDEAKPAAYVSYPVGWLIVVEGQGRGSAFSLFNGVSNIGRGTDQTVSLDFGDNSISREAHASIAYDARQQSFFIGHCGKANIVRRNDRPVLSTEELSSGDHITIGETVLRFVPLCGPDFSWEKDLSADPARVAHG